VWTSLGINKLHPNLFVFLVGPPGVGKTQAIEPMTMLLRKSQAVGLAPTDLTKQGLLDALADCGKGNFDEQGRPFDYHFMAICIRELSNFMSQYDGELAGLLTDLFDCPSVNEEKKRSGAGKLIPFPGISFIMGTATENLGATIHKDMWGSGFMARVVMVFSAEEVIPADMFKVNKMDEHIAEEVATALRRIGTLKGTMEWTEDAQLALRDFRINQSRGAPIHNRLKSYVTRRWLHLAKLCMIAALADERMEVELDDFATALSWLEDAESEMPEIFKDMISHEDGAIYEEMRMQMWAKVLKERKPLTAEWVWNFLSTRASSHAVPRMLEVAEKGGYIERVAGTSGDDALYYPGKNSGPNPGVM
jgi:energy-coupling factor transporter ATP-binding protein EcfA2